MEETGRAVHFPRTHTGGLGSGRTAVPGKPVLTLKGKSLNEIPGVTKGFGGTVQSAARAHADKAMKSLFSVGDRAMHPKFGTGTVTELSGSGVNARIMIRFDDGHERTLSLAVAPIVRMEAEE